MAFLLVFTSVLITFHLPITQALPLPNPNVTKVKSPTVTYQEDDHHHFDISDKGNRLHPSSFHKDHNSFVDAKFYTAVAIDTRRSHFTVSPRFLSFSVSPRKLIGTSCIPWDATRLKVIARGLTPAWLRIGGTEADYVTFVPPGSHNLTTDIGDDDEDGEDTLEWYSKFEGSGFKEPKREGHNIVRRSSKRFNKIQCHEEEDDERASAENSIHVAMKLQGYQWDRIQKFAKNIGWKIIFMLNVQLRNYDSWDMTNAASFIEYSAQRGYATSWELGNEPTRFSSLPNVTRISPEQLSYDFSTLKNLLASTLESDAFIAGPDIASRPIDTETAGFSIGMSPVEYLRRFLSAGDLYGGVVNAITWHQYYVDGRTATLRQFISSSVMDKLQEELLIIKDVVSNYSIPVWLGETGDTYHGGAPGLSNTYTGGFLYMDKLGLAAALGIQVVMKQTLIGVDGLLQYDLTPLPTYWVSVLYKQLVGTKVLSVQNGLTYGRKVRIYSHCTKHHRRPPSIIPKYYHGDVTLIVINTYHSPVQLILLDGLEEKYKDAYFFTPMNYNIKTKNVALNGVKLRLKSNGKLPQFPPVMLSRYKEVLVPALSYGFVVIKNAKANACIKY